MAKLCAALVLAVLWVQSLADVGSRGTSSESAQVSPAPTPPPPDPATTKATAIAMVGAANAGDVIKTWKDSLKSISQWYGWLAGGGHSPSPTDIAELAGAVVSGFAEAVGMANPLLGILMSFGLSFLTGLFASEPLTEKDVEAIVCREIEKIVPNMIQKAIIASKMADVKNLMEDFLDHEEFWSTITHVAPKLRKSFSMQLEGQMDSHKRNVFGDCWDDLNVSTCKVWQQAGSAVPATILATLHITSILEVAQAHTYKKATKADKAVAHLYAQKAKDMFTTYWTQLQASRDEFAKSRMADVTDATVSNGCLQPWESPFGCPMHTVCCHADDPNLCNLQGGMDQANNSDIVADCQLDRTSFRIPIDTFANCIQRQQVFNNISQACVARYRDKIQQQVNTVVQMVDSFGNIGNITHSVLALAERYGEEVPEEQHVVV